MSEEESKRRVSNAPTTDRQARLEAAITPQGSRSSSLLGQRHRSQDHFHLQSCDFKKWLRRDSWSHDQAAFILMGHEPPPLEYLRFQYDPGVPGPKPPAWEEPEGVRDLIHALKTSIDEESIPCRETTEWPYITHHIKPMDLVDWAKGKGYGIPEELNRNLNIIRHYRKHI
jgi:hypothetical protein